MPLTPEEKEELSGLRRMAELEAKHGAKLDASEMGMGEKLLRTGKAAVDEGTLGVASLPMNYAVAAHKLNDSQMMGAAAQPLMDWTPEHSPQEITAAMGDERKAQANFERENPVMAIPARIGAGVMSPATNAVFSGAGKVASRLPELLRPVTTGALGAGATQVVRNASEMGQGANASELPSVQDAAMTGGAWGLAGQAVGGVRKLLDKGSTVAANMTPKQAQVYKTDPVLVDKMYEAKFGDNQDPKFIQDLALNEVKKANAFYGPKSEGSQGLKSKLAELFTGDKQIKIPSEQLKATGFEPLDAEIARLRAAKNQAPNVFSEELGRYTAPPEPSHYSFTLPEVERLNELSQQGTKFRTDALGTQAAASNAKAFGINSNKAIVATEPAAAEINQALHDRAVTNTALRKKFGQQPSRALESSSNDLMALTQKADEQAGTRFGELRNALQAARTKKPSGSPINTLIKAAGRGGLRTEAALDSLTKKTDLPRKSILTILGIKHSPGDRDEEQ